VQITPLGSAGQRPFWAIWTRQGDSLRLAFYDGVAMRPEDFAPRNKLIVLSLVPAPAASVSIAACDVLRAAGVDVFLGGATRARPVQDRASAPGSKCRVDSTDGSRTISLMIVAAPGGSAYLDAARREAQADRDMQIEEEPALGPGAFSIARRWTFVVVAVRSATAVVLRLDAPNTDRAVVRRFAQRVLDTL
jgi:hypothetical protein